MIDAQLDDIMTLQKQLYDLRYDHWLKHELFTSQWWIFIPMLIIPWIIWWRVVDKTRRGIIFAYGLFLMLEIITMNDLGIGHLLWFYPIKLVPSLHYAVAIDCAFLPVLHMLIYQYFPQWKTFIIAEIISSFLLAFVGEPLAEWSRIYIVLHWYHFYSFPIYVMKAIFGKWLIESIIFKSK